MVLLETVVRTGYFLSLNVTRFCYDIKRVQGTVTFVIPLFECRAVPLPTSPISCPSKQVLL